MTDADDFAPPPLAPPTSRVPLYRPHPYATGPTSVQPVYPEAPPEPAAAPMRDPFAGVADDPELPGVVERLRRMFSPW